MKVRLGVVAVFLGAAACSGSVAGGLPHLLLPDLDQRPPVAVSVRWGGPPKNHPLLVFTSSGRLLREVDYSNDDSSTRIRLLPDGLPGVVVLNTCEPGQC